LDIAYVIYNDDDHGFLIVIHKLIILVMLNATFWLFISFLAIDIRYGHMYVIRIIALATEHREFCNTSKGQVLHDFVSF
jgi:hypothetical protein